MEAGDIGGLHLRPGPGFLPLLHMERQKVERIERKRVRLLLRHGNLYVFAQKMILLLQNGNQTSRYRHAKHVSRLKGDAQRLPSGYSGIGNGIYREVIGR